VKLEKTAGPRHAAAQQKIMRTQQRLQVLALRESRMLPPTVVRARGVRTFNRRWYGARRAHGRGGAAARGWRGWWRR